jgi:hypothetical protein
VLVQVNRAIAELANLRSTVATADDRLGVVDLPPLPIKTQRAVN